MTKKIALLLIACTTFLSATAKVHVNKLPGSVTIANDNISATFSADSIFDILSLKLGTSGELVEKGRNLFPWTVTYLGAQGQTPEMTAQLGKYRGYTVEQPNDSTASLVFVWDMLLNYNGRRYPVSMRTSLSDNSDLLSWDLEVALPEGWTVREYAFPSISLSTPSEALIITPAGWGNLYRLEQNGIYDANYPSWSASMQLIMAADARGAFYYAATDRDASGKLFRAAEKDGALTFTTRVTPSDGWIDASNTFRVPWTNVTGHHPGGWEAAAMHWYRPFSFTTAWGSVPLKERLEPQWLRDKDLWFRVKNVDNEARVSSDKIVDYFGDNIMFHWYIWHHHAYDSHYPDYFPAQPEFKSIIDHFHSRKCHIVPYINGRLWDPCSDAFTERGGADAVCRRPDGSLYTELYLYINTVACPASEIWHDIMLETTDSVLALGTDGIYIDQIAAAAPHPCYSDKHGHPRGGGSFWVKAYLDMMRDMRRDLLRPGHILFSEENSECFLSTFDILLTLNTPHSPKCKIVPLYPMIYSDRTQTAGFTYTPGTDMTTGAFRHIQMQCLLYGSQLGWVEPRFLWASDKDGIEAAYLKGLADFRRHQHDVFVGGRYIREIIPGGDNPTTDVPTFGTEHMVKGAEWQTADGRRVVYVVNSDSKPHTVTLPHTAEAQALAPLTPYRFNIQQ